VRLRLPNPALRRRRPTWSRVSIHPQYNRHHLTRRLHPCRHRSPCKHLQSARRAQGRQQPLAPRVAGRRVGRPPVQRRVRQPPRARQPGRPAVLQADQQPERRAVQPAVLLTDQQPRRRVVQRPPERVRPRAAHAPQQQRRQRQAQRRPRTVRRPARPTTVLSSTPHRSQVTASFRRCYTSCPGSGRIWAISWVDP
jgi:hypothetical protein